jgi:hypothetical protein
MMMHDEKKREIIIFLNEPKLTKIRNEIKKTIIPAI